MKRWLPFTLWLLLLGSFITLVDEGRFRHFLNFVNNIPYGDKAGHIFLIGTLAFLFNYAMGGRTIALGHLRVPIAILLVMAAMTCEEFSQIWIPWRTFDLGDLAANYTGCLLAWWLSASITRRKQGKELPV